MHDLPALEAIFFAALEMGSPEERAAYLDEACAGDPETRRQAEKLLAAQAHGGSFLEKPAVGLGATVDEPVCERPGTVIGPYKLCNKSAKAGWARCSWPSRPSPFNARSPSKSSSPAWTADRSSPASRPSGRRWR